MATNADKLKRAKQCRTTEINRLNELLTVALAARQNVSEHSQFLQRYKFIDSIRDNFSKLHNTVCSLISADADDEYLLEDKVRATFDENFFSIKTIYYDLFEKQKSIPKIDSDLPRPKLPELKLTKFNGDIKHFTSFIDVFDALIHNNTQLTSIEKFSHLLASLEGPPKNLVQCHTLSSANYLVAYNALKNRYSNTRILATFHWNEIENAPRLTSENPPALRKLLDTFTENIAALKNLQFPTEQWDFILTHMLLKRLDTALVSRFELQYGSTDMPNFDTLKEFVSKQCIAYETMSMGSTSFTTSVKTRTSPATINSSHLSRKTNNLLASKATPSRPCVFCNTTEHLIYNCPVLLNKLPRDRYNLVKQYKLCVNCLSHTHASQNCNSASSCKICQYRHHSLLHYPRSDNNNPPNLLLNTPNNGEKRNELRASSAKPNRTSISADKPLDTSAESTLCHLGKATQPNVLLSTAELRIRNSFGYFIPARAILDSGSESCYISRNLAIRLGLKIRPYSVNIYGLGGMKTKAHSGEVHCTIHPRCKTYPTYEFPAIVLDNICSEIPAFSFDVEKWEHIKALCLADPDFNKTHAVDLILGANVFSKILLDGSISPNNRDLPPAINTTLGYVLMGEIQHKNNSSPDHCFFTTCTSDSLNNTLQKFWSVEEVPQQNLMSSEDTECEHNFLNTTYRNPSGRFVVSLPFRTNRYPKFENSKLPALRRFFSLERRLNAQPALYKEYCAVLQGYLDHGHMELATYFDPNGYYLPHHCVLKPESSTTQVRVVFDASSKDSNNQSLNDMVLPGPKLQNDIAAILLKFRLHSVVLTADIKAMYRQILIDPSCYTFQRILWRFSQNQPLQEYFLKTVTFGVNSSPYLALRTLLQLADEERETFPVAAEVLASDIYVDDIVTGCDTPQDALQLQRDLTSLLFKGGFELRKWMSNDQEVLSQLPQSILHTKCLTFDECAETTIKILGLKWDPAQDCFLYSIGAVDNHVCNKRHMLSQLARIYDPLGFLAPVTLVSKVLIQKLWSVKLDWDECPPKDIIKRWTIYTNQLPHISSISIPRHVSLPAFESVELCGFCDGSSVAYAACVYIRFVFKNTVQVVLLCAKCKVAPLKQLSIPRIELCGALLLTKLMNFVLKVYYSKFTFKQIFAFTDSTIVLHWLNSSPHRWKPFVGNRISLIQQNLPQACWQHVSSENNIADAASRGLLPLEFVKFTNWWTGPEFLQKPHSEWPTQSIRYINNDHITGEQRKTALLATTSSEMLNSYIDKYSSLQKLQRVFAYVQCFIFNLRNPRIKRTPILTVHDLQAALLLFIKHVQNEHFIHDIEKLRAGKLVSKPLRKLGAFLDEVGVLRVGGRLQNSLLNYERKHPILLPQNSRLTSLIIEYVHSKHLHPGLQTTLYLITQNYWILSARRAAKRVLSKCYKCFRCNPLPFQPLMGNLPANRVSQVKPFSIVGVDFGGPFFVTSRRVRGSKSYKAYICIFVCFATKAIHLELVSDLSSDNYLCALRRFIARRGRCTEIVSDNATNFVGANRYLMKIFAEAVKSEQIKWSFNPPHASHFGGLFEAGIKSVKTHLARVIGDQCLTYEEFNTVLIQIESLLNSRPLCALSNDPNDYRVLTPGHFLTLEPLTCIPDPDLSHLNINRLDRYQLLTRLHHDFWTRWHNEYLNTLQQKLKWNTPSAPAKEGALVLIKRDNLPPMSWKLARITRLFPGRDNIARVAEVQTAEGWYTRPLNKLCPLPDA